MERSEPSLVPQWLKNTGTQNGSGCIPHSDDHTSAFKIARNKSFVDSNGNDFERSLSFDKTTSSYFRRSFSSNGSSNLRSRSSFGRNQHDRDWERGTYDSLKKYKSFLVDRNRQHRDLSDSPGNTLLSNLERDGLRHLHSVSGKRGDTSCNKVASDLSTSGTNTNGLLSKGSPIGGVNKITFEREFPLLGTEEKAVSDVGRVPSPGLTTSVMQSLPIGTSSITGEKWTSALAEVPVLVGGNGAGTLAVQHDTPSGPVSLPLGTSSSLNMAEAVAQGSNHAQIAPQLSVGTQRLEELAIKQFRQLIPMTPSSPKTMVSNSSDKLKTRVVQQPHPVSSQLAVNHSPRGVLVKGGDASRASSSIAGKLHVLKQAREKNNITPLVKDSLNQASGSKLVNSTLAAPVSGSAATTRVPATNPSQERKSVGEKRPTLQAQSRNDFFNSVRKKSMADSSVSDSTKGNSSSVTTESSTGSSPSVIETDIVSSVYNIQNSNGSFLKSPGGVGHFSELNGDSNWNGDACVELKTASNQNKPPSPDPIFSEEEEAAFLRSLGWEENADEGGLTEEEINAFFQDVTKYINSKPSLKILQGVHPKFLLPVDSPKLES